MRAPRHAAIAVMALTASTHAAAQDIGRHLLALTRGRRDGENAGPRYDNNTGEPLKPLAKSGNKSLRQQLHRKVFHARRHGYPDSTGGRGIKVASDYGCLYASGNDVDQGGNEQYAHDGYAECFAHNSLHPRPALLRPIP